MDGNLPLLTVIIVVYNGAASIENTIQSTLHLNYENRKIIIIDGGSSDGTTDIIKKYQQQIYYWISEPDKGIYDAMNKGWAQADHDSYIIFLGSGDKILQLPDLSKNIDHNIIYGSVWIGEKLFNSVTDFRLKLGNTVHHQALLIKKSIHPQPPFSLDYPVYADFDFNQRLYKSGIPFIKDKSFYSYALEGGVSAVKNKKESLRVVKKNFGKLYSLLASIYYFLQDARNIK
ncbi:glycosyltransferase [Panacibacter ginsenosidivorans]|uniref:Glycosyltransferase n=1 Tax=Panacibacter ginsenosidivorans TaxID=1813871 RepID=A0A5B8VA80_9BACT|nr:glycosyltransferase [Panacibacter ginsenosidivorans]QEC68025.1 glycosyltransferase [Panacibacter ginsenosidivorans]